MRLSRQLPECPPPARTGPTDCIVAWLGRPDRDTGGLTPVGRVLDFGARRGPGRPFFGPFHGGATFDDARLEIRGPCALADQDVAADANAPWDDRPLADDRD